MYCLEHALTFLTKNPGHLEYCKLMYTYSLVSHSPAAVKAPQYLFLGVLTQVFLRYWIARCEFVVYLASYSLFALFLFLLFCIICFSFLHFLCFFILLLLIFILFTSSSPLSLFHFYTPSCLFYFSFLLFFHLCLISSNSPPFPVSYTLCLPL